MAEFGMWGPQQSGVRLAEQDNNANIMQKLSQVKTMGEIQQQPAEMALKEAHAKLYGAEADEKIVGLQVRRSIMEALANRKPGTEATEFDPSIEMRRVGQLHMERGDFKTGREYLTAASLYDARMARASQQEASTEHTVLETAKTQAEAIGKISGSIVDQASYHRGLVRMSEMGIDTSGFPESYEEALPQLRQWADSTMSQYQRLQSGVAERRERRETLSAADQRDSRSVSREVQRIQRENLQLRNDALRRNGGLKPAGAPSESQVSLAALFIKNQRRGEEFEGSDLAAAASTVASDARRLMQQNPALSFSEAMAQSYNPQDFQAGDPGTTVGGFKLPGTGSKTKFSAQGRSVTTPLPLPAAPSERRVGRYYTLPSGKVLRWAKEGNRTGWAVENPDDNEDDKDI